MTEISCAPDVPSFEMPIDAWTAPFWAAAGKEELLAPACEDCGHFRWPPGPFCPCCRSQAVRWVSPGQGRIYSFTIIREAGPKETGPAKAYVPALIEFPQAGGFRLLCAIVDTPLSAIEIGKDVALGWSRVANVNVPVFCIP